MKKKTFILSVMMLVLCTISANAQWAVGVSGGWDWNTPTISSGYATDVQYKGRGGYNVGIIGRYQFIDWLAVRADLKLNSRCYKMQRNLDFKKFTDVYTNHRDTYLHLPVMADLSMGGSKLRGHLYLGGYAGYWLDAHRSGFTHDANENNIPFDENLEFESNRDNRFNAGLIGGLGISYLINDHFEVMFEGFYMYDLTKSNKTSSITNLPRYNSTTDINVGVMYNF